MSAESAFLFSYTYVIFEISLDNTVYEVYIYIYTDDKQL